MIVKSAIKFAMGVVNRTFQKSHHPDYRQAAHVCHTHGQDWRKVILRSDKGEGSGFRLFGNFLVRLVSLSKSFGVLIISCCSECFAKFPIAFS